MLGDPGVIGRALEGDVEGELHVVLLRGGYEVVEVVQGAKFRVDGFMAAFYAGRGFGADSPGAAVVAFKGGGGIVLAFAEGGADGMDGRQIEDVEAHGGDFRQLQLDVCQGAVFAGNR